MVKPKPGHILPGTPIAVDYWHVARKPHVRCFFLTHCHADHMQGLGSTFRFPLYCSPVSARLLPVLRQVDPTIIRPLTMGTHRIPLNDNGSEWLSVTIYDAHHCPGSVMYLFEGYFGRVLYTGDFRYCKSLEAELDETLFCRNLPIDVLYLDNTYWPKQCTFPSREDAQESIMRILDEHSNQFYILFGVRRLGKEDLLCNVANHLDMPVLVSHERMQVIRAIYGADDITVEKCFTLDPQHTSVEAVQFEVMLETLTARSKQFPTVLVVPTALEKLRALRKLPTDARHICISEYSDHSSATELRAFLNRLRPRKIIPLATPLSRDEYEHYVSGSPPRSWTIPNAVLGIVRQVATISTQSRKRASTVRVQPHSNVRNLGVSFDGETYCSSQKVVTQAALSIVGQDLSKLHVPATSMPIKRLRKQGNAKQCESWEMWTENMRRNLNASPKSQDDRLTLLFGASDQHN